MTRTGEPRLASWASWAVLTASFGLSASTWIALAVLAGFTDTLTIPGIGVTLAMAWLMPIAVDGYVVVALVLWMAPVPAKVAAFAKKNTYGAAGIGIAAQSAYHLLATMSTTTEGWRVALAAIVGALPPAVAALAVHMRALVRRESGKATTPTDTIEPDKTEPVPAVDRRVTAPAVTPEPTPIPEPTPAPTTVPSTVDTRVSVAARAVPSHVDAAPPSTGTLSTSGTDDTEVAEPAVAPEPMPTPAHVADRNNQIRVTGTRTVPAPVNRTDRPTPRPRPNRPTRPAPKLAPSTTDTHVSASDAAQLTLPLAPDLLDRATTVARQYRKEHGTPITPGQLAVRLKVTSDEAAQALAVIDIDPNNPAPSTTAVNGRRVKATR